ncbi:MAG: VOC family protein [Methanomassiliicoccales archaeon]|jgi:catechol 2,3-dioxygenase-like lactoylglutathione lyase family enzyme
MIEAFEHVALEVQSAEASMRFYVDVFGAAETNRWESKSPGIRRIIFIDLGGTVIELIERGSTKEHFHDHGDAGIKHICLRVKNLEAVMAMVERLGAKVVAGVMVIDRSRYEPVLSDGTMDLSKGMKRAVVSDPDGILIELLEK